ncbi:hypothetical protein VSH64_44800 [Amycolatopsis rhabdoformis]|uniref:Uncharacterized protein n=1 Tax=Amycolatopsis rhabdoformis TaxID=1448059 RepID=A0ABZ1I7M9_9PSEU|nr:hypothetical protein [Amycolatopsis rhabdoformis]WSE29837.1 hypothetical protein VSH64_44800 [Amycolatopsis rhabdoformis]
MNRTIAVNYPAPIPVGHVVEVTEFADTRPEKKRRGFDMSEAFRHPMLLDRTTGIRYLNHVHVSASGNGGNTFTPVLYPVVPRADLVVSAVWLGTVVACAVVMNEGLSGQHTTLVLEPA